MSNTERSAAVLEVEMLELFAEALEHVRPVILRQIQSGACVGNDPGHVRKACETIAAEAASRFQALVASGVGRVSRPDARPEDQSRTWAIG